MNITMKKAVTTNPIELGNNCFDVIRYWAAFSVMFLHYTGYANRMMTNDVVTLQILRRISTFFPGVVVLFALSGFLIAGSFERAKTRKEYLKKRVFRLYPELWFCTLINLVVLFIFASNLIDTQIVFWIFTQIFGISNTPGCLSSFATGSVNGALWTIFTEIQLYVVLCFIYRFLKKMNMRQWIIFLACLGVANITCDLLTTYMGVSFSKIIERLFIPYALWFFMGTFCYCQRNVLIPFLKHRFVYIAVVYVLVFCVRGYIPGFYADILTGVVCPLLVIGCAYLFPRKRLKIDFTYGIFLYHWIVLNVIVHLDLFNRMHWLGCVLLYIVCTIFFAWLSWRYVGKVSNRLIAK